MFSFTVGEAQGRLCFGHNSTLFHGSKRLGATCDRQSPSTKRVFGVSSLDSNLWGRSRTLGSR
jgi:hypothetical protein